MTKTRNVPFQFSNELVEGKRVLTLSGNIRKNIGPMMMLLMRKASGKL